MKNILTPLSIIAFAFISCKNETETKTPKAVVPFYQVANQQQNQTVTTPQPNQGQSLSQEASAQVQTVAPAKVAKGMNPPHGQPGHRCDIPVGAPLNSPKAATSPQAVSNPGMTVSTNAVGTQTAKGMNPPHGQPGHRCDIAVGAPLNSPVATNKPATPQAVPNYIISPPATSETPAPAAATPTETTPTTTVPAQ